jgi:hypothetical protein
MASWDVVPKLSVWYKALLRACSLAGRVDILMGSARLAGAHLLRALTMCNRKSCAPVGAIVVVDGRSAALASAIHPAL